MVAVAIAPACASCGAMLEHPLGGPVCERCWASIRPIPAPRCDVCGDPIQTLRVRLASIRGGSGPAAGANPQGLTGPAPDLPPTIVCRHCRDSRRAVDRGSAVGAYEGALRGAIHAFKYGRRRSIGRRLGDLMRTHGEDVIAGADLAVPVPLHRIRQHSRGFNQAFELASRLGLPVRNVLARRRATRPQVDLPAAERHRNVSDAFALRRYTRTGAWRWQSTRLLIHGAVVVVVDDVSTTGATLDACARALKAGGAREVRALTAARTIGRGG